MKNKLREIRDTANRSIFVGERREKNLQSMATEALIVMILGVVMFAVNVVQGDYLTGLSPLAFTVSGLLSYCFAKIKKNRRGAVIATVIAVIFVLSYDVLFVSNGFAFLWTLLIPLSVCYFFGIKEGFLLTLYYQILFVVVFYTPLRSFVEGHFSEIVMTRFPLLYFFNALITLYVMYEYHKSVLFELDYTERLNAEVEKQTRVATARADKLERLSYEMVETLAMTIDAKDTYTNGHSFRVSQYSVAIADKLGWSEQEKDELRREAMLHDIGKIGVPDFILNKPGKLTAEEFSTVQTHARIGEKILRELEDMGGAAEVALHHHERYDGWGYPSGLAGKDIPSYARIVAIADAYDAMHSDRVYRRALSMEAIRAEMVHERGRQFDPEYLDAFLELMDSGVLDKLDSEAKEDQNAS